MKMQVFAIKDRALNAFMQPFYAHTVGAAVRAFGDGINEKGTPMNQHPDDYDLWHLGEWNDLTGEFVELHDDNSGYFKPEQVAIGKNMIHGS